MDKLFSVGKQFLEESMQQQGQGQGGQQQHGQQQHQYGQDQQQQQYGQDQRHGGQQRQEGQYQDQRYQDQDQQYQGGQQHQGRNEYNSNPLPPGNKVHGGNYPAGGDHSSDDWSTAHEEAARYSGGSHDSSFFSNVVGAISDKKGTFEHEQIDEHDAVRKHQQVYNDDSDHVADGNSLGTAAAMNVLKNFVGGGGGSSQPQSQSGLMGMAIAEAGKLFDAKSSQGKVQSGTTKDSAMREAGQMAVKMWMQSQAKQSGAGGLMDLASKFM